MESFNVIKGIVEKTIEEIKPYEANPRFNDKTVEKLVKIIPMVGFNVPLVIDKQGVIVKGHARFKAGKILGMTKFPCIISEATDEQNRLDRISDNRVQEFSQWLGDSLKSELTMLNVDTKDLEMEGFLGSQEDNFIDKPMMVGLADLKGAEYSMNSIPQKVMYIRCVCEKCQHVWLVENNKDTFVEIKLQVGG